MNMLTRLLLSAAVLQILACSTSVSQSDLATRDVATSLDTPWEILWGPDNMIWMTERKGAISRVDPESGAVTPVFTVPDVYEQSETGLLGMALHPSFATSPFVYVVYTYLRSGQITERMVRYTYNGTTLIEPRTLIDSIPGNGTHVGSRLVISPDGMLIMSTGDRQDQPSAQSHNAITGKMIRMTLDGTVPSDNPWPSNPWPTSLIWTTGHRNPQGLAFGPQGSLYSSEHGANSDDEINLIEKGRNYGWPNVEGRCDAQTETQFCNDSNVFEPLFSWTPTIAPAGIEYYPHTRISQFQNKLLMVSLNGNGSDLRVFTLTSDGRAIDSQTILFDGAYGRMRDLCISPDGRVFMSTSNRDGRGTVRAGDDRIMEITQTSGVTAEIDMPNGRVVPQPLVTESLISFDRPLGAGRVELFDALGSLVRSDLFEGGSSYRLLRNGLAAGAYILSIVVSDATKSVRVPVMVQ